MGFNWRKRVDKIDTVLAADVNELADEILRQSTAVEVIEKPLGVKDDVPIQAAIDKLAQLGSGTVYIQPGTYDIQKEIRLRSNVNIVMTRATLLKKHKQYASWLSSDYTAGTDRFYVEDVSGFCIGQDIGIVRGTVPYPAAFRYEYGEVSRIIAIEGSALVLDTAFHRYPEQSYKVADKCVVFSHFSTMLGIEVNNVKIVGGELDGNKAEVLHLVVNADADENGIASAGSCSNMHIHDVVVHDYRFQGIHPWGTHPGYLLTGCECYGCDAGGFCLDTISYAVIKDNYAHHNGGYGLAVINCAFTKVEGGRYWDNGDGVGLHISHTYGNKSIMLKDVDVRRNAGGILMGYTKYSTIDGAVLIDNSKYGIKFMGDAQYNHVTNTFIQTSLVGICEYDQANYNQIGIVNYDGCVDKHLPIALNTNSADMDARPTYVDVASAAGLVELPMSLPDSIFDISVEGQSTFNILNSYGDMGRNVGTYIEGICQAGTCVNQVYLEEKHRQASNFYRNMTVLIVEGAGSGSPKRSMNTVGGYDATLNYCGMMFGFDASYIPTAGSKYRIYYMDSYQTGDWHFDTVFLWRRNLLLQMPDGKWGVDTCFSDFSLASAYRASGFKFFAKAGRKYMLIGRFYNMLPGTNTLYAYNMDTVTQITGTRIEGAVGEWRTAIVTVDGDNSNVLALFRGDGGYPDVWGYSYAGDWMVIDLSAKDEQDLPVSALYAKYGNYEYFANVVGQSCAPGRLLMYKDKFLKNMMEDWGDTTLHASDYTSGGTYGALGLWHGCATTVDGEPCIDNMWSDFVWPSAARANYIRFTPMVGRRYVIIAMFKGKNEFIQLDCNTGNTIKRSDIFSFDAWTANTFTVTAATAADIVVVIRSAYVTENIGYMRKIMLIDLSSQGDSEMSEVDILVKYGTIPFFNNTKIEKDAAYYDLELPALYAIGVAKDKVSAAGILEKNIQPGLLTTADNLLPNPTLSTGTTVATGYTAVTGLTGQLQVTPAGQKITITGGAIGAETQVFYDIAGVAPLSLLSCGILISVETPQNIEAGIRLSFISSTGSIISSSEVTAPNSAVPIATYINAKSVPTNAVKCRVMAYVRSKAATSGGVVTFKNIACCVARQLELYEVEGVAHLNYQLVAPKQIDLGMKLSGIGAAGDPIKFSKSLRETCYYDTAGIVTNINPIVSIDRIELIHEDLTRKDVDTALAVIAADKKSFTVTGLKETDLIMYTYTHGMTGLLPVIVCTAAKNIKAQSWMAAQACIDAQFGNVDYRAITNAKLNNLEKRIAELAARIT